MRSMEYYDAPVRSTRVEYSICMRIQTLIGRIVSAKNWLPLDNGTSQRFDERETTVSRDGSIPG